MYRSTRALSTPCLHSLPSVRLPILCYQFGFVQTKAPPKGRWCAMRITTPTHITASKLFRVVQFVQNCTIHQIATHGHKVRTTKLFRVIPFWEGRALNDEKLANHQLLLSWVILAWFLNFFVILDKDISLLQIAWSEHLKLQRNLGGKNIAKKWNYILLISPVKVYKTCIIRLAFTPKGWILD